MAKKRIAILFGGASRDHNVSLKSAFSVLNGLCESAYDIIPIGITKAGRWLYFPGNYSAILDGSWESDPDCCSAILSPDPLHGGLIKIIDDDTYLLQRLDVIFPILHGSYGECGQIQALCKLSGISYVGSGFSASNACSDKVLTHMILNKANVKTAKYYFLERIDLDKIEEIFPKIEEIINYPMCVKAALSSRTTGAKTAHDREELKSAIKIACSHHHKVLIEETLNGREFECLVWGSVYSLNTSPIAEAADNFELVIPAGISENLKSKINSIAKKAFITLGCKGFARFSFKLVNDEIYCCNVTNVPVFSEDNIMAKLMEESGYKYSEMLDLIINSAKEA